MKRIMLGIVAAAIGGGVLWWTWSTTSKIRASATWPTTTGQVVRSAVVLDSTRQRGGGYNLLYQADVRYRYEVEGKSFESGTFTFGVLHAFADRAKAESEVALYPAGRNVLVYFDRSDPGTSCLLPGTVPDEFNVIIWMSLAFLVAGMASILSGIIGRRKQPRGLET